MNGLFSVVRSNHLQLPADHLIANSRKRRFGTSRLSPIWRSDRGRDLLYSDEEEASVLGKSFSKIWRKYYLEMSQVRNEEHYEIYSVRQEKGWRGTPFHFTRVFHVDCRGIFKRRWKMSMACKLQWYHSFFPWIEIRQLFTISDPNEDLSDYKLRVSNWFWKKNKLRRANLLPLDNASFL